MERGLLWLPLLAVFVWLVWSGWNEYQKVESYRVWAEQFDRAKYDIYAVLGQKERDLTWGLPTRKGPVQLETFSLMAVESIRLLVDGRLTDMADPPAKGRAVLEFLCRNQVDPISVGFTEPLLAVKWGIHLQQELKRLQPESLQETDPME